MDTVHMNSLFLLLDNKLHKALGLNAIEPDDVMLSPKLIK